jgi:hypothetical protein
MRFTRTTSPPMVEGNTLPTNRPASEMATTVLSGTSAP